MKTVAAPLVSSQKKEAQQRLKTFKTAVQAALKTARKELETLSSPLRAKSFEEKGKPQQLRVPTREIIRSDESTIAFSEEVDAVSMSLIIRKRKHCFALEGALVRINKDFEHLKSGGDLCELQYGICVYCGKPINEGRLLSVPNTTACVSCKESNNADEPCVMRGGGNLKLSSSMAMPRGVST